MKELDFTNFDQSSYKTLLLRLRKIIRIKQTLKEIKRFGDNAKDQPKGCISLLLARQFSTKNRWKPDFQETVGK